MHHANRWQNLVLYRPASKPLGRLCGIRHDFNDTNVVCFGVSWSCSAPRRRGNIQLDWQEGKETVSMASMASQCYAACARTRGHCTFSDAAFWYEHVTVSKEETHRTMGSIV